MKRSFTLLLLLVCMVVTPLLAQQQTKVDQALRHIEQRAAEWQLDLADLTDVVVSDEYVSRHNGAHHVYLLQRYAGIPLYTAINGVHFNNQGEIVFATNSFEGQLVERINTVSPAITPEQALGAALQQLNIPHSGRLERITQAAGKYFFDGGDFADNTVEVSLAFMPMRETEDLRLAWHMTIDDHNSADYWSVRVDALDGTLLHQHNYTVYCNFDHQNQKTEHAHNCVHQIEKPSVPMRQLAMLPPDGSSYNVYALPAESPIHGERVFVTEPADTEASPFGWHDTNGVAGSEYTITRGNNVHAYQDSNMNNSSANDEPDGGAELLFDFYFDIDDEPENMVESGVTQLFYMNNMMHDITYHYGFDEASGNFQQRNYTNMGQGSDHVFAEAQDGSGTNNANFSTPSDGANGRMQMFRWFGTEGLPLTVDEPADIAGAYNSPVAGFGPSLPEEPLTAEVVQAFDGTGQPNLVCQSVVNADEIAGKIALIDRGECFFEEKVNNAEAAGAVAVIICNYLEDVFSMGGGVDGSDPNIVSVMITASDCNRIKDILAMGETVTATIVLPADSGPESVGSSMDNGVIAHEYGHGISNRLTGGPSQAGCLGNDEQQGEGWSDFFALITTVRPGDEASTPRGIGNYSARQPENGGGIRRLPYSFDLNVNDHDMDDILATGAPHPLGEVWATAIWDLYWAMADVYGFDEDLINGTGGNNMAIQLVMDGMKLQNCNPGFMDARDAVIAADFLNYNGVNECLIWEVFARRGMGAEADQNDRFNRNDNEKDFSVAPYCIQELKIAKSADRGLVTAGDNIEFRLEVSNDKLETVTGVIVQDALPTGLTYVPGSASGANVTDNGDNLVFDVGDIESEGSVTITYEAATNIDNRSIRVFYDGMEDGDDNWELEAGVGFDIWDLSSGNPNSGSTSWFVPNVAEANDQLITLTDPFEVTGLAPTLRFYHDYNTEVVNDGGLVQVSTDGGFNWQNLNDSYIRNGYRGDLAAQTLFSPIYDAFWGDSDGYVDSYVDLSDFIGETIQIRFRFVSNGETGGQGWYVDDIEIMDLIAYEGEACAMSNEGDMACAVVPANGVIVDTEFSDSTDEPQRDPNVLQVYPNPTNSVLNLAINADLSENVNISLVNAGGAVVRQWQDQALQGRLVSLQVSDLPAGFYFLQLYTPQGIYTEKVTIK